MICFLTSKRSFVVVSNISVILSSRLGLSMLIGNGWSRRSGVEFLVGVSITSRWEVGTLL